MGDGVNGHVPLARGGQNSLVVGGSVPGHHSTVPNNHNAGRQASHAHAQQSGSKQKSVAFQLRQMRTRLCTCATAMHIIGIIIPQNPGAVNIIVIVVVFVVVHSAAVVIRS